MDATEKSVQEYLSLLASPSPTPGGGSAAALSGALGASLAGMCCAVTLGNPRYASVEELMKQLRLQFYDSQCSIASLMQEDADAFSAFKETMRLPKNTAEEKSARAVQMETALKNAACVPLQVMEQSLSCLRLLPELSNNCSPYVVSDAYCASSMLFSAMESSAFNVRVNTRSMKDRSEAERLDLQADAWLREGKDIADQLSQKALGGGSQ